MMFFFLIAGNRYITKAAGMTSGAMTCPSCGTSGQFPLRTGRNYVTLFFVIPIFPIGAKQTVAQCPNCSAQFAPPSNRP